MAGRPTAYTEAIGAEICLQLAAGESLRTICEHPDIPTRMSVHRWLFDDTSEWDKDDPRIIFRYHYARARSVQAEGYFDDVMTFAKGDGSEAVNRDRLKVDAWKWILARMDGKRYGEKQETTLRGDPEAPLHTETTHKIKLTPEQEALMGTFVEDFVRAGDEE